MKAALKKTAQKVLPPVLFERLMLTKMRWQRQRFAPRVVQHRYGGHQLKVELGDPVGQDWYDHDWSKLPEIELLKNHGLRAGAKVFDIGAHQGIVALMLAREVGSGGKVVAVEASPFNARLAEKNRELNAASQIQILNVAASDQPGTLALNEDSNGQVDSSGRLGKIEVPCRTIDSLSEEFGSPDVIFLDIEGFECAALRGASETLKKRPDCFVEVHVGAGLEKFGGSVGEVVSYFPSSAYRHFVLAGEDTAGKFREVSDGFFSSDEQLLKKRFFFAATRR